MTDVIGNALTIIRNGVMASKPTVEIPYSKVNHSLADILQDEGFVRNVSIVGDGVRTRIKVELKYVDGESTIHDIRRVSRPGRRQYAGFKDVKPVIGGLGITILTTSKGLMSQKSAKSAGLGGEVICTVW